MMKADSNFPLDQYHALRTGFGIFPLQDWSSVTLTGADRQAFFNNFCTNDVKRLEPGEHCEAFITNVKGKVLGHGLVDCRQEELVFITVPDQAAPLDRASGSLYHPRRRSAPRFDGGACVSARLRRRWRGAGA